MRPNPPGNKKGAKMPDKMRIRKEDRAYGLQFQGKRDEEGKEVGEGEMTREEARAFVDKCGEGPYKLNLGGGRVRFDHWVHIDKSELVDPDLKIDLEEAKLPFDDNSIEEIRASHVFEHIHNFIPLMNECRRVLKPRGLLRIFVPIVPFTQAFADPTHVRFFTQETFDYFDVRSVLWQHCGADYGIDPWGEGRRLVQNTFELLCELRK